MGKKYYFYKVTERRRKRELEGFNEEIPRQRDITRIIIGYMERCIRRK